MWTNPSVVPIAYPDVRAEIQKEVDKAGATLDQFNLRVEEGWFKVSGKASKTGGSVTFSVHAVPKLVRPGECFEWEEQFGEHFEYCTPTREESSGSTHRTSRSTSIAIGGSWCSRPSAG
jgi:hypothetical protein